MIYYVTKNRSLIESNNYKIITVQESLNILKNLTVIGVDTETEGLDVYTKKLLLLQLGNYNEQIVIDCTTIDVVYYKDYLESKNRLFLFWNAKFDLKFLYHHNIYPTKVYDGYLAEKLMWLGYPPGIHSLSLKTAGYDYCNIELDKSVRGKIIGAKYISDDIIVYAATDVKYLEHIKDKQLVKLKEKDLLTALNIENRFVLVLAYIEYCGVRLDIDKWKAKMKKDEAALNQALKALNDWVINNPILSKYTYINRDGDLFEGFDLTPKVKVNWNSQQQVIPLFKDLGIDTKTLDKATKKMKDSLDAKVLKPQRDKSPIIPLYLKYKELIKVTSTYGQNFIEQINPVSYRIHTNYNQMGADTTRITSGGKDKFAHVEYVNLLNLPADAETRACFTAEKGNKWISIDYSGQETYLMASIANDKAIIKELTEGSGDIHSLTAYMSYHEIPRDTPIKDIKSKYHNLRQEAKGIEFAINYGGDANTISNNKGIPIEEAQKIYDSYMNGFKGLQAYQKFRRKDWLDKGYILLNPLTGHKAYIYDYEDLMKIKSRFNPEFWDYYREMKTECPTCDTVQQVRYFFKRKSATEKQSINYPIQATGSMCLRFSLINFWYWIVKNNLINKVKICITPYDEINCEAPEDIAEKVATEMYNCMINAGKIFCTKCKLDADMSRLPNGELPTYWIH